MTPSFPDFPLRETSGYRGLREPLGRDIREFQLSHCLAHAIRRGNGRLAQHVGVDQLTLLELLIFNFLELLEGI
jgi:hypothetical protein